jgi:hypothetical protein
MKIVRNICAPFTLIGLVAFLYTDESGYMILCVWFALITFCSDFLWKKGGCQ